MGIDCFVLLQRPRSNSFSSNEYVSSDMEEDRTSVRSTRINVEDRQKKEDPASRKPRGRKTSDQKEAESSDKTGTGSSMESVTGEKGINKQTIYSVFPLYHIKVLELHTDTV